MQREKTNKHLFYIVVRVDIVQNGTPRVLALAADIVGPGADARKTLRTDKLDDTVVGASGQVGLRDLAHDFVHYFL